jgi:hypothetical protein
VPPFVPLGCPVHASMGSTCATDGIKRSVGLIGSMGGASIEETRT